MKRYQDLTMREQREKQEREESRSKFSKSILKVGIDLDDSRQYVACIIILMSFATPIIIVAMTWWFRLWFKLL